MNVQQLQKRADAKMKARNRGRAERGAVVNERGTEPVETLTGSGAPNPSTAFDQSKASVAEVLAHVAQNPDRRKAVLAAERKGKKRKGVLDGLKEG